jgi:hypothetical protein
LTFADTHQIVLNINGNFGLKSALAEAEEENYQEIVQLIQALIDEVEEK